MHKYSFFRYGLVGVYSVVIDYMLLYMFFSILGVSQNIAITLSFFGSSIFNFYMHRIYTFKKKDSKIYYQILKYILLIVVSYFITIFSINILVDNGLNIFFAKFISVCIVYIYGYLFGKFFIFRN